MTARIILSLSLSFFGNNSKPEFPSMMLLIKVGLFDVRLISQDIFQLSFVKVRRPLKRF